MEAHPGARGWQIEHSRHAAQTGSAGGESGLAADAAHRAHFGTNFHNAYAPISWFKRRYTGRHGRVGEQGGHRHLTLRRRGMPPRSRRLPRKRPARYRSAVWDFTPLRSRARPSAERAFIS